MVIQLHYEGEVEGGSELDIREIEVDLLQIPMKPQCILR